MRAVNTQDESHSFSSEDTKDDSGDCKMRTFHSFHPSGKTAKIQPLIMKSSKLKVCEISVKTNSSSFSSKMNLSTDQKSNNVKNAVCGMNDISNKEITPFLKKEDKPPDLKKAVSCVDPDIEVVKIMCYDEDKDYSYFKKSGMYHSKKSENSFYENKDPVLKGKFSLTDIKKEKDFREVKKHNTSYYEKSLFEYPLVQDMKLPLYVSKGKTGALFVAKIRKVVSKIHKSVFDKGMKCMYRVPKDVPEMKFWNQRFYYYSRFDEGIKMDYESWYSVTPEDLSFYIAKLAGKESICIDPFAGSGGNVIQFSRFCKKVYAVDIDPTKIDILKNNCQVYKCPKNYEVILHDFLTLKKNIQVRH